MATVPSGGPPPGPLAATAFERAAEGWRQAAAAYRDLEEPYRIEVSFRNIEDSALRARASSRASARASTTREAGTEAARAAEPPKAPQPATGP